MGPKPAIETAPRATGASSTLLGLEADVAFATLTDLAHLSTWNERMTRVVALPDRVEPGAEWTVEFAMFGRRWQSRSRVTTLDTVARRFEYRTHTDDGNPSFADWYWGVEPEGKGCHVNVSWELYALTFWRRVLFSRVRARQLAHDEVPASLTALGGAAVANRGQISP
jgi:hypothetical protein